jgi:interferon gamma-inducible protein 30
MLPYGNAHTFGGKVRCQHGEKECELNMVEACGIKHLPDTQDYMDFIFCVEGDAKKSTPDAVIKSCAKDSATAASITACYGEGSGAEGTAAIAAAAQQTAPLNHEYTPWLVINGKHSTKGEDNLKKAICAAYKGSERPAACSSNDEDHVVPKCYPKTATVVV